MISFILENWYIALGYLSQMVTREQKLFSFSNYRKSTRDLSIRTVKK